VTAGAKGSVKGNAFGERRRASIFPGFDRRVWFLLGAMLVFRFGQGFYYPFSTIYFHNVVGIPLSLVGVGLAALAVASVASGIASGPLNDRYGRKPLMLVALSGSATTFFAYAFVGGFRGYLAVCVASGLVGGAMFDAARNAMVADVAPEGMRARAFGLVRVGGNLGWALGPTVAGIVTALAGASAATFQAMFAGTAVLTLVVLVALALLVRESLPGVEPKARAREPSPYPLVKLRAALSDAPFVALLAASFLLYYVFTQDWQALPVYAKNFLEVSDWQVGLFLAGNGLVVMLLQLPVAYLLDGRSKVAALAVGAALFASSSTTLLLTESFLGILVAFAGFFTLAEMILEVAGAALAAELAPVERRGTYLALFGCCFGAGYGISPIVAGLLLDARLPALIWTAQMAAATLALCGLAVLAALRKRSSGRPVGSRPASAEAALPRAKAPRRR
jgi:MFS family permease